MWLFALKLQKRRDATSIQKVDEQHTTAMKKGTQILMQVARFKSSGDQHFHHPEMQPGAENRAVVTAGHKITG